MKKSYKKFMNTFWMVIGLIVSLAIGGAFISGLFLNVFLLSYLPQIVHSVVGYIISIGGIVSFLVYLFGK